LKGNVETVGPLSGTGAIAIPANQLLCSLSTTSSFSGTIAGSGSFTKAGWVKLILTGTNTYTGVTLIQGGTLQVDGVQSQSLARLTAGRLQGFGTGGQMYLVSPGGTVAPGASPGILACSNLNSDGAGIGILEFELNGS